MHFVIVCCLPQTTSQSKLVEWFVSTLSRTQPIQSESHTHTLTHSHPHTLTPSHTHTTHTHSKVVIVTTLHYMCMLTITAWSSHHLHTLTPSQVHLPHVQWCDVCGHPPRPPLPVGCWTVWWQCASLWPWDQQHPACVQSHCQHWETHWPGLAGACVWAMRVVDGLVMGSVVWWNLCLQIHMLLFIGSIPVCMIQVQ